MVQLINRKNIDLLKYDTCIQNAFNSKVYAFSWYLDIVTNKNWSVLILNNYKAVMPISYSRIKKKLLKKMVSQPIFCQQLGVFSLTEMDLDTFNSFLSIFKTLKLNTYQFNNENNLPISDFKNTTKRNNFILNLKKPYLELQSNFSKNLKRNIKKGMKNEIEISHKIEIDTFIGIKINNSKHRLKTKQINILKKLISELQNKKLGVFYVAKKEMEILAVIFIIKYKNRLIHLQSVNSEVGKKIGAIPFLFHKIIEQHCETDYVLDFEGSMLPGVAKFFTSFGSVNEAYYRIKS